jgi:Diacylglycerol kinase catalytic domain
VPTQRGSRPPHRFTAHAAARAVRSGLAGRRWRAHQERLATLPRRPPRGAPALGPVESAGSRLAISTRMVSGISGWRPADDLGVGETVEPVRASTRRTTRAIGTARRKAVSPARLVEIVATPGSGNGRAMATAIQLREALRARGQDVTLEVFSGLEHLRRWATTSAARSSLLICVGGDGTQSTAATAAVRRSVPFLPVPAGFGNLFARAFGHPTRVDRVVELVERGVLVHSDVGIQHGEIFLCHASFGLLSEVQDRVEANAYPRVRWSLPRRRGPRSRRPARDRGRRRPGCQCSCPVHPPDEGASAATRSGAAPPAGEHTAGSHVWYAVGCTDLGDLPGVVVPVVVEHRAYEHR